MNKDLQSYRELLKIAGDRRILLVFLREFGCVFCRETMVRLAKAKDEIEATNTKIVIVHMAPQAAADKVLGVYELDGITHISDSEKKLYQYFGLKRATLVQLLNPINVWRAFKTVVLKGHLRGQPAGDTHQMPGIFLFERNQIIKRFSYKHVSDMPDFLALIA